MRENHDYTKICFRLSHKDDRQRRALEILQTRSWQLKRSYAQSVTDAILGYFDEARLTDDELVDKFADRVQEMLQGLTLTAPQGDSEIEKAEKHTTTAPDEIDDIDIAWDFVLG